MDWINDFSLYDVFLVALGLIIASLLRIFYDSYKEKQKLKKLDQTLQVYNSSMDIYEEGILIVSDTNEVVFANKEAQRIFQANEEELTLQYFSKKVQVRAHNSEDEYNFIDIIQTRRNIPHAYIIVNFTPLPVSINTSKFHMSFRNDDSWRIVVLQDISAKLELQARLDSMGSYRDLLTNLPTRYHLTSDLVSVIMRSAQKDEYSAIAMFSIKDFIQMQVYNGIEKMDILIRTISRDVAVLLEKDETFYRIDNDAFAIIFENLSNKNDIRKQLDLIIIKVQNILIGSNTKATMQQGLYFIDSNGAKVEKILNECYRILRSKYNEKIDSIEGLQLDVASTQYLANKLTKEDFLNGIKNKDFFFFYQPIFGYEEGRITGLEVLTRLNHKSYGFLMANDFMSKAIEYGIMSEITSYLLDNVLKQKKFWVRERGIDLDMTINLALSDIQSGVFAETLEKKLLEYHINPKTITIDIPEILLLEDIDSVSEEFTMLKKIGVNLAIDHFGKESINLNYIERLPLDLVKIDGDLIKNIMIDKHSENIVSAILSLSQKLELQVAANHVDSEEIKLKLEELGCDFAQGYYFGKAVPAFEVSDLIGSGSKIFKESTDEEDNNLKSSSQTSFSYRG